MSLATAIAAFAGVWLLACLVLWRWLGRPPEADERHPVATEDGWLLTLHRYRPAAGAPPREVPLVLGHGINMNRTAWGLSNKRSLARALAARGHDVFVAEYRGESSSRPPLRGEDAGQRWAYSLMDHARYDLPAIIDVAARLGGSEKVSWIGHSMGGLLLYLYVALHGDERMHRVVTLGSPVRLGKWPLPARQLMGIAQGHLRNRGTIPMVLGAFFALPLIYLFPRQTLWWTLHRPHATRSEAVALCTAALEDVSNGVSGFFLEMSRDRKEVCPDEGADTGGFEPGGLRRLTVPLLVVSAELDGLAPPKIVEPAFHRAGSEYAAFVRLGDPDGDGPAPPFGHCDMISGDAALTYVLPLLAAWIEGANPEFVAPTLQRSPSAKRRFAG